MLRAAVLFLHAALEDLLRASEELRLGVTFLAAQPGDAGLTNLCQQLLASNEFLYVD